MVWRLVSRRRYLLHNESPEPPAMPCRRLNRTGFLTGSGHHPHVNYFSFFPVVFTSSKRFALQNVALASLPCASGSFLASISLRRRLFIFLSGTKALLLKENGCLRRRSSPLWRPKTSNWRSESLERGGIFAFPLRAPSGTRYGGEGKLRVGLVAVAWREGNKNRCLILQSLAAALAA